MKLIRDLRAQIDALKNMISPVRDCFFFFDSNTGNFVKPNINFQAIKLTSGSHNNFIINEIAIFSSFSVISMVSCKVSKVHFKDLFIGVGDLGCLCSQGLFNNNYYC